MGRCPWPPGGQSAGRLVAVEAAAALPAEQPCVTHRDEARWRCHPLLARLLVERLARVHVHVDADQVDELARTQRPPGAVLHPGVEILDGNACLVEHADAVVQQGDQHAVDDEARRVEAADRMLAELLAQRVRALEASSEDSSARTISTSGINGAGLKKCMPTTRSGVEIAEAISVTESADVFVASTAS